MRVEHKKCKIAIAGAGITGAYLYRLLGNEGHHVDIFDVKNGTRCGLTPCAWGTSRGFAELVAASGLDPERYILRRHDQVMMDDTRVEGDLMTFDKPRLVKDLLKGTEVRYSPLSVSQYDRVIDASGVSRAYLPAIKRDIILKCMQCRVQTDEHLENRIKFGEIGYAWCFPLAEKDHHIGCGSYITDANKVMSKLGWLSTQPSKRIGEILCRCEGKIRLTSPHYSQPFVIDGASSGVWGVGEAIGCVAPLAGDGVVPGMRSAQILVDKWDDPAGYTDAILNEFKWMKDERAVIDKLISARHLGAKDVWILKRNVKRMGIHIGLKEAAVLIKRLR